MRDKTPPHFSTGLIQPAAVRAISTMRSTSGAARGSGSMRDTSGKPSLEASARIDDSSLCVAASAMQFVLARNPAWQDVQVQVR